MRITFTNDFHGTEASCVTQSGILNVDQVKRLRKKLCGMSDCSCGDVRGGDFALVQISHDAWAIEDRHSGQFVPRGELN